MGPMKQLAKMFEKGRIIATVIYIVALGLTLWAALKVSIALYMQAILSMIIFDA